MSAENAPETPETVVEPGVIILNETTRLVLCDPVENGWQLETV